MPASSLEVPRRPRPGRRSRWGTRAAVVGAVALVVGWAVWFALTPEGLPVSGRTVEDFGTAGTPLYIGMFTMPEGRTIDVTDVSVEATGGDVAVEAIACRGGSVSVTTAPEHSCEELDDPLGQLRGGDSIMLQVTADAATEATIGRIEISFREGLQWGTAEAGIESASISFADRPGDADEPGQSPSRDSSAAARSAASVISSASIAFVRWNQVRASLSRPACSSVSA